MSDVVQIDDNDTPNVPGSGQMPEGGEAKFTQADIDRIVKERLARQKSQFADYDDLKTKAAKFDELEQAQKSELEKWQEQARKANEAKTKAEQERESALREANNRLIKAAFIAEAGKLGAIHPEDAYLLADLAAVSIADDGAVTGVAEAVKALLEAGRLVTTGRPQAPSLDAGAGDNTPRWTDKGSQLTPEELHIARKTGVTPEQYLKAKNRGKQ